MLKFVVAVVLFLVAAVHAAPHKNIRNIFPNGRIIGGADTTIEKVPWQVALEDTGFLFCAGSIISENYVLSSAYCTFQKRPNFMEIRSGTSKLQSGGTVSQVSAIFNNQIFTQENLDYDVSVIKLTKPLVFSDTTAAVPLSKAEATEGDIAQVTGWGTSNSSDLWSLEYNLQIISVSVVSRGDCSSNYIGLGYNVTDRMICAAEAGKDSCQGDSGGALTIDGKQAGIVSWGYGCAEEGYPGVYSNVAAIADFINENSNNEATWV